MTKMVTRHFHRWNKRCVGNNYEVYCNDPSLQEMFGLCVEEPWDEQLIINTVDTTTEGWITMSGFLAFWT